MPSKCVGYAAHSAGGVMERWEYEVRDLRDNDVDIEVVYSGICHTDLHMIKNDWKVSQYPIVPGHEIAGVVKAVGKGVSRFKIGDHVGVGCMIWSCRQCNLCKSGSENYCKNVVQTYSFAMPDGEITRGGFSNRVIAPEEFAVSIPKAMPLEKAAPLLCAGITCWSPMVYLGMDKPGKKIGVIGLGGLGHMAVQFGAKFGNEVTVISTSRSKEALAKELGASEFIVITDPNSVAEHAETLDFIIDTVSAEKPVDLYLSLLRANGVLCTVGLPEHGYKIAIPPADLIWQRKSIVGSVVGSVSEMNDMMKFCADKDVAPYIEMTDFQHLNEALQRLEKNDVRFRFVIDVTKGI